MSIQIYSAIWPYVIKCCAFKMLWIFLFVTVCISSFLMIMFKSRKEDLKKSVLTKDSTENIHGKLNDFKEDLKIKKAKTNGSVKKTTFISKPSCLTNKKPSLTSAQKILVKELKTDVIKIEKELAELEHEILSLSNKRENIEYEISKVNISRSPAERIPKMYANFFKRLSRNLLAE